MEIPINNNLKQVVKYNSIPWFYDVRKAFHTNQQFKPKDNSQYFDGVLSDDKYSKYVDQFVRKDLMESDQASVIK